MRLALAVLGVLLLNGYAFAQEFALEAAATVGMRGNLDVRWTAPQAKGGLLEIRPAGKPAKRVAYAYTIKNPTTIVAPEKPGEYVLVLIFGGQDRASQPLTVQPAQASLSAAGQADAGAIVTVSWEGPNNRSDLVTFATPGGAPIRGTGYAYVGNSKDGTVQLQAPKDAGSYEIVYVSGKTVLARTPISIGGISATLSTQAEVPAGSPLAVKFIGPNNSGDIITFAARNGPPIRPASYVYTGNAKDQQVTLRAFEASGSYDVVYISGNRVIGRAPVEILPVSMRLAASDEVPALLKFNVAWYGQGNGGDRIIIVEPGETTGSIYRYIDPLRETVSINAPEAAGPYELVYLSRGGKELARRPIAVTPAAADPGQIEVEFAAGSGFAPGDAIEVILDASGSMLQQQNGERRIAIAKRTLTELVTATVPPGIGFALRVFGNREANACRTDLEIPLGAHDPAKAAAIIGKINAVNLAKTPIAQSLSLAAEDLSGVRGKRVLILITDGEETCGGDPGQVIQAMRAAGVDVRVNIVGYAIDDSNLASTFEAWAAAGGGEYFEAADAGQLSAALQRATAPPFRILDQGGELVAAGLAGDPPVI